MSNKKEEKSEAAKLKEKLFVSKKNGCYKVSAEELEKADEFCKEYKNFLDNGKIEREAVAYAVAAAEKAGFTEYDRTKTYSAGDKVYVNNRNKAIILAVIGKNGTHNGVRLGIAHIDSPRLDLKPNPLYETSNLAMFKTHYYGGIKKYQWPTVPLALHGVVAFKDGTSITVAIGDNDEDPVFCVTDLLPHLAVDQMSQVMTKAFNGEHLNVLIGSRPFSQDEESENVKLNILSLLYDKYNITEEDFLSADLTLVPAFKARDLGFDRSMIGAYGHDDKVCAYPALMAAINAELPESTVITVLTDREEIGSDGNTGMKSTYTIDFIEDLAKADGEEVRHVMAKSTCLSADVNAAFDPTYASAFEANNSSYINNGAVITKYTGSGGKYSTSDASAEYMAKIRKILDDAGVLWQTGELGKVDGGGGGTIAKFVANLNADVVDLGVPVLSMHAPMEVVSKLDVYMTYRALYEFYMAKD
ncbi:MAG: aminopeptidase [Clostridia bacterium]|nr:aminopeptidase [Clostridia bacterium]